MPAFASPVSIALLRSSLIPAVSRLHPSPHRLRPSVPCRTRCSANQPETPEAIRALLTAKGKAEQQKGLLLVRQLPPAIALELLLLSVQTSANEFIRSSAAIAIGQLPFIDTAIRDSAVNSMISLLATDSDYSVRAAAAAGMGYASPLSPEVRAMLREALTRALLEDSEWQVQFSCLVSLGSLKDMQAIPVLCKWMRSDNDLLVQAAAGALGDIGDPKVVPELLKLLGSSDMMTRQRLAQALGQICNGGDEPAVVDALRTLNKDQSLAVRDAAAEALSFYGCADIPKTDLVTEDELLDAEVASLLKGDEGANAGASTSEALRRRLERSFAKEFTMAEEKEADMEEARQNVGQIAASENVEKREQASISADAGEDQNNEKSGAAFKDLVNDLKHGNAFEQTIAAIKLRQYDGKRAAAAILSSGALDPTTSTERLRSVSLTLLARGGETQKLVEMLGSDPDQNVRSACCDALTDVGGGESAVDACIKAFCTDKHWLVRVSAAITLGTIGKGLEKVEDVLISALKPGGLKDLESPQDVILRRHAVTALGFLGSTSALKTISALLESEDCDDGVRYRIAAALRGILCNESAAIVRGLIDYDNSDVSQMAQGTLDALAKHGF